MEIAERFRGDLVADPVTLVADPVTLVADPVADPVDGTVDGHGERGRGRAAFGLRRGDRGRRGADRGADRWLGTGRCWHAVSGRGAEFRIGSHPDLRRRWSGVVAATPELAEELATTIRG
ncbi:hypothetical protein [Saccharopolyspora sp. ASAGF58]|uniref:hypothetical protein n=1 Tax=Saccharopolyspora sp. ASAGF58 TaxID=2719023 RepID=UPI001B31335B|nr:hypothetical protein [Saccharopolyspora sp. ASAGF58]